MDEASTDIVRSYLDAAGIDPAPDELVSLVAVYQAVRARLAPLQTPAADDFEPADVYSLTGGTTLR